MSHQENAAIASTTKPEHAQALVQIDHRRITVDGFKILSVLATFLAGLQAQLLSISLSENSTIAAKLVNAFWLAGIYLDVLGAVLSIITTRWLELLNTEETRALNEDWSAERKEALIRKPRSSFSSLLETTIATALFSGLPVVACGVGMFLIGLAIYIWTNQPLLVSIISTIPFVILFPLAAVCFYPQPSERKIDILELLARKRGEW